MINHITLTEEQAKLIRGRCGKYSEINPIQYEGNWIIPERCLIDDDMVEIRSQIEPLSGVITSNSEDDNLSYLTTNVSDGPVEIITINKA